MVCKLSPTQSQATITGLMPPLVASRTCDVQTYPEHHAHFCTHAFVCWDSEFFCSISRNSRRQSASKPTLAQNILRLWRFVDIVVLNSYPERHAHVCTHAFVCWDTEFLADPSATRAIICICRRLVAILE